MEIQASLQSLHLSSPQAREVAQFYCQCYAMTLTQSGPDWVCTAPGRKLVLSPGPANQLQYAHFGLHGDQAWASFVERTQNLLPAALPESWSTPARAFKDPDGNLMLFVPAQNDLVHAPAAPSAATLQHFALRSTRLPEMLAFYQDQLGFVLSDVVKDDTDEMRACFFRTEHLHHVLALFGATAPCFDHQSFEVPAWDDMKRWGDHMAKLKVPIVWGLGRHGPGNDVFFMVRDPDGNLAEISSEIESCSPTRPAGVWPHEERTLNLWGKAILRS